MRAWQAPELGVRHARRRAATVVVLLVAVLTGGLISAVAAVTAVTADSELGSIAAHVAAEPRSDSVASPAVVPRGEPIQVLIPSIAVDADLVPLGLRPDRAMEVPEFGRAGWYAKGPRPGYPGPAVLAAHVDSWAGPDVFFRLRDLVVGDQVHVIFDSGDRITFVVTWSERTPKDELPVESIWPVTNDRLLALITCGGTFDRGARSYQDNVIVYALPLDHPGVGGSAGGALGGPIVQR